MNDGFVFSQNYQYPSLRLGFGRQAITNFQSIGLVNAENTGCGNKITNLLRGGDRA